ncbi:hypothetical protein ABKN59_008001 [Abortiporus biennis]
MISMSLQPGHSSQILLVDELLREIIRIVDEDPIERLSTLSRLARVCKGTSGPALDALWHTMYTTIPIFRQADNGFRFHQDSSIIKWPNGSETCKTYSILYCPKPCEEAVWDDVLKYSSRVRILDHPTNATQGRFYITLDRSAVKEICKSQRMLFPNLEILHWPLDGMNYNSSDIEPFLSPSIKEIHVHRSRHKIGDIFTEVHKHNLCNLESIKISEQLIGMNCGIQKEVVKNSPRLHTYRNVNDCSIELWLSLAASSTLGDVLVTFPAYRQTPELPTSSIPVTPFPVLGKVSLAGHVDTLISHIKPFKFPFLVNISLSINNGPEWEDPPEDSVGELIDTLAERIPKEHVHTFNIYSYHVYEDRYNPIISPHVFDPLKAGFINMRVFRCNTDWKVYLDDAILTELAIAWPKAIIIDFSPDSTSRVVYSVNQISVTLKGVLSVLRYCPDLKLLGLVLDADVSTLPQDIGDNETTELQMLSLGPSVIHKDAIQSVAQFLYRLTPRLEKLEAWMGKPVDDDEDYYGIPYRRRWRDVTLEIQKLRKDAGASKGTVEFPYATGTYLDAFDAIFAHQRARLVF